MTLFEQKVYAIVRQIPRGKVATYGAIARALGNPRAARAVGNALNKNRFRDVPCHRVVRSNLNIGGFRRGASQKMIMLRDEGVMIQYGKVDPRCIAMPHFLVLSKSCSRANNELSGKVLCHPFLTGGNHVRDRRGI